MTAAIQFVVYLAFGGLVYLLAYGDPGRMTLKLFVVMFFWPFVLVWLLLLLFYNLIIIAIAFVIWVFLEVEAELGRSAAWCAFVGAVLLGAGFVDWLMS